MKVTETDVAAALAALGHEARLVIFRLLVRAGPAGLNIGEIGAHVGMPPSTLAHHLDRLVQAGLVAQRKSGREVLNRAQFDALEAVLGFVAENCCAGVEKRQPALEADIAGEEDFQSGAPDRAGRKQRRARR